MVRIRHPKDFSSGVLFCAIGVYSINNTSFDVSQTAFFGLIGIAFVKLACEAAPLLLAVVIALPDIRRRFRAK